MLTGVLFLGVPVAAGADTNIDYEPLRQELADFLDGRTGEYGVYLIDLRSGAFCGYNAREIFHGASTFKVPLNLYLYEEIAAGRVDPNTYLAYREGHYEEGTGYLQEQPFGSSYRIERLARDSIIYSDNVATNMLLGYLGRSRVVEYMRMLGGTAVSDQANTTCAEDLALYFRAVLEFAREHPEHGERLLNHLRNTVHRDRIPRSLPPGIPVAHKIGNWPAQGSWHDAGIVGHPFRPYIIAILSKNTPGYVYACAVVRDVSRRAYDYQSNPFFDLMVYMDGHPVSLPGVLNRDGRFLVPVRAFVGLLSGYAVQWIPDERTVLILDSGGRIALRLEDDTAELIFYRGRTYLPLRRISEQLGYVVRWDPETDSVHLSRAAGKERDSGGGQNFVESLELQ
jgi:beta-lactamase class A